MNFIKKSASTGILILCYFILCNSSVQAQVMTQQLPREKLLIRLNRIGTLYNKNIVFDTKQVANIEVPALKINSFTIEQTLNATLQITGLSYKKTAEQSYLIEKKTETKPQHSSLDATLKGRIVESETSEPIPGAAIRLSDKQYAVSDFNGYYSFPRVPDGKVVLEVSYVGFKPEKAEIMVKKGETTVYDIKMSGSQMLKEVEVKSFKRATAPVSYSTIAGVLVELKTSNSIVSGISSEQISKSADRNAADVVKRIPGVTVAEDKFIVVRGMNQRYNITYLNGNIAPSSEFYSKAFSLDMLPTSVIDRILVYKSPSADLQGDYVGGAVKIFTKNAVPVKHLDIGFQIGVRSNTTFNNYNTYTGGKYDWLGIDDGTRKLPGNIPSYRESGGYNPLTQKQLVESFSTTLAYKTIKALPDFQGYINYFDAWKLGRTALYNLSSVTIQNENRHTTTYKQNGNTYEGTSGTVQDGTIMGIQDQGTFIAKFNGMENLTWKINDRNQFTLNNFFLNDGRSSVDVTTKVPNRDPEVYRIKWPNLWMENKQNILRYQRRFLYSGNLEGEHLLGANKQHEIRYNVGYSYSLQDIPDQRTINLYRRASSNGTDTDPYENRWQSVWGNGDDKILVQGVISRIFQKNSENTYNGSADYTVKITPNIKFKTGTYNLYRHRQIDRRNFKILRGGLTGNEFSYEAENRKNPGFIENSGISNLNLIYFREQDLNHLWRTENFNEDGSGLGIYDVSNPTDRYVASEQNNSVYFMGELQFFNNELSINGGVRYEYHQQKVSSAEIADSQSQIFIPVAVNLTKEVLLPSLDINFRPNTQWVVRASYGKTVNRPELREIAPFNDYDYMTQEYVYGNTTLKTSTIDNYDFRMEYYPVPEEQISLGVFYKTIKDPIEQIIDNAQNDYANVRSYFNPDKAIVYGLEAELRKNLGFIPIDFFRNLSVLANGALIKSQVEQTVNPALNVGTYIPKYIIGTFSGRPLQGHTPYVLNAGLYYENKKWGSKLGIIYNLTGNSINAIGLVNKENWNILWEQYRNGKLGQTEYYKLKYLPNLLELSRQTVDISYTQRVYKNLQCKFNVQNLFNAAYQIIADMNMNNKYDKEVLVKRNNLNGGFDLHNEGDYIYREYKPGRYFNMALTYTF